MVEPTFADYVKLLYTLFDEFWQLQVIMPPRGRPVVYAHKHLIMFFVVMQLKRIYKFKAEWRWLTTHPTERQRLGLDPMPVRTTLSRRYKALYPLVQAFIAFLGQHSADLGAAFECDHLFTDKSLFKAQGPVWHQSDRKVGRIPEKLRHLDTDASWSKSSYHGWVYGYGLHFTCNQAGFPLLAQVETASISESEVLDDQEIQIVQHLAPDTVTADNSYTKASRIRQWAARGVILLTPAAKWVKGRYAVAYHQFIQAADNAAWLAARRTAIEPIFDLIAKVIGTDGLHKPLPIQRLPNVRTCLALGVLTIQMALIANSLYGLPLHDISHMLSVFT